MTAQEEPLSTHGVLMRAAQTMARDKIASTRADGQAMVRRFEPTATPVLSLSECKRFVNVLIAAAGGDRVVSERFEEITDHMTALVLPVVDDLRLVDNESLKEVTPGTGVILFPPHGMEATPVIFLAIQVTQFGRIQVEVEGPDGPECFLQYRLSAHVVGKDGVQVHKVDTGR